MLEKRNDGKKSQIHWARRSHSVAQSKAGFPTLFGETGLESLPSEREEVPGSKWVMHSAILDTAPHPCNIVASVLCP